MKTVLENGKGEGNESAYRYFEGHSLGNSRLALSWCEEDGFLRFRMDVDIPKEVTARDAWFFEHCLGWAMFTIREKMDEEATVSDFCSCPHWALKKPRLTK
jgi:hypothetical protein